VVAVFDTSGDQATDRGGSTRLSPVLRGDDERHFYFLPAVGDRLVPVERSVDIPLAWGRRSPRQGFHRGRQHYFVEPIVVLGLIDIGLDPVDETGRPEADPAEP